MLYCYKAMDYITDCAIYQNVRTKFNLSPLSVLFPCRVKGCWSKEGELLMMTSLSMQMSTLKTGSSSAYLGTLHERVVLSTAEAVFYISLLFLSFCVLFHLLNPFAFPCVFCHDKSFPQSSHLHNLASFSLSSIHLFLHILSWVGRWGRTWLFLGESRWSRPMAAWWYQVE